MGGGGGGGESSLDYMKSENARKDALRARVNSLYGIGSAAGDSPDRARFVKPGDMVDGGYSGMVSSGDVFDEAGYDAAIGKYTAGLGVSDVAKKSMAAEEAQLSGNTRSYYEDELNREYTKAKRMNKFALADRGQIGGSEQGYSEGQLKIDQGRGATRVTDEVTNSINALRNNREQERLLASNLINTGAGEDAVSSASAGLNRAFSNAAATQKANITSGLFSSVADAAGVGQNATNSALAAQLYRQRFGSFYPGAGGSNKANVTSTG